MIPCLNCGTPTPADATIWRCVACARAGAAGVNCSAACFYEHAATHDQVGQPARWLENWEATPEVDRNAENENGGGF